MKLINKTGNPQEVNLVGGSSVIIGKGESMEIDESKIYDFEISRISRFFEIQKESKKVKVEPAANEVKLETKSGGK